MSADFNDVLWSSEDEEVAPKARPEEKALGVKKQHDLWNTDSEEEDGEAVPQSKDVTLACASESAAGDADLQDITLTCKCGKVSLGFVSEPVLRLECCCLDCRRGLQVGAVWS